jgi:hypothetical protein
MRVQYSKFITIALISLLVLSLQVGLWLYLHGPKVTYDSCRYIDGARNYAVGRGFMVRPFSNLNSKLWIKPHNHPPGYSLIIFTLMYFTGLSAYSSAFVVTFVSGMIIVVVILLILSLMRFPSWLSLVVLLAMVSMPSYVQICVTCWSEAPCMALCVSSLAFTILWSLDRKKASLYIWIAGILAGLAWVVRNSALACSATIIIFLLIHLIRRSPRKVGQGLAFFCLGLLCSTTWLLLQNLHDFGTIMPYRMPPSDSSLIMNFLLAGRVIVDDIISLPLIQFLLPSRIFRISVRMFALLGGIIVAVTAWNEALCWLKNRKGRSVTLFVNLDKIQIITLLLIYAGTNLVLIIISATKYKIDPIGSRFLVPIYWVFLILIAFVAISGKSCRKKGIKTTRRLVLALLISLCFLHLALQSIYFCKGTQSQERQNKKIDFIKHIADLIPPNQFVLSNQAELFCIYGGCASLMLRKGEVTVEAIKKAGYDGKLWGIVIWNRGFLTPDCHGEAAIEIAKWPERFDEFEITNDTPDRLVLRWKNTVSRTRVPSKKVE